jgi:hypothetical protein
VIGGKSVFEEITHAECEAKRTEVERDDVGDTGKKRKKMTVHGVRGTARVESKQKQQNGKRGSGWELEHVENGHR